MKLVKTIVMVIMLVGLSSCAQARTDMIGPDGQSPVVNVVRNVREAVVQISVEMVITPRQSIDPFFNDPFFRQFFGVPRQQQEQQQQQSQTRTNPIGTGFIYEYNADTGEAFIMTNNHVAKFSEQGTLKVALADKKIYDATVVGMDANTDVAVIKIKPDSRSKITITPLGDSSKLEIGEWAIAIGNPFGDSMERTVTLGVISALSRSNIMSGRNELPYQDFIQTDAAINPGNSGGPLLNIKGEVIGINTAIISGSGGNIGIGFAIPINLAKRVVEDLVATGKVQRAYIGILPQEITSDLMEAFEIDELSGVLIAKVEDDSPASKAGLQAGDIVLEVGKEKVANVARFRLLVATAKIGDKVPVKILRDGKTETVNVTLEGFPEDIVAAVEVDGVKTAIATGIKVDSLDSDIAKRLNVQGKRGVLVSAVDPNTPAARAGLAQGMIILEIDGKEVNSISEFNSALSTAIKNMEDRGRNTIRLYVLDRNNIPSFVVLRFEK